MSNKYKILEMLKENELTVKEIADKMEFNENETRVYIHRLLKDNLIKEIGKKNRYIIYTIIEKDNKKESHSLDTQILKKMIKPFAENDIELNLEVIEINRIKKLYEMIK